MNIDFSSTYKISSEDRVFIDTNILIFLFSPDFVSSKEYQIDRYSKVFEMLVQNGCKMYINSHVISEYINRCLRIDFDKNVQDSGKTKLYKEDYRNSPRYEDTLKKVLKELNKFLSLDVIQLDDSFSNFNIIDNYKENMKFDFNDMIIAKNVKENSLYLLSDDSDFSNYDGIDINWYMK